MWGVEGRTIRHLPLEGQPECVSPSDLSRDDACWRATDVIPPKRGAFLHALRRRQRGARVAFTASRGKPTSERPFKGVKTMCPLASWRVLASYRPVMGNRTWQGGLKFIRGKGEGSAGQERRLRPRRGSGRYGGRGLGPMWNRDCPVVGEAQVLACPSVLGQGVDGEHEPGVRGRCELRWAGNIPEIGVVVKGA